MKRAHPTKRFRLCFFIRGHISNKYGLNAAWSIVKRPQLEKWYHCRIIYIRYVQDRSLSPLSTSIQICNVRHVICNSTSQIKLFEEQFLHLSCRDNFLIMNKQAGNWYVYKRGMFIFTILSCDITILKYVDVVKNL